MSNPENIPTQKITAVILAGGRATRMGGQDKGLLVVREKPMIEYVIARIQPQASHILISANRNFKLYQQYGYPVVPDGIGDYFGPLGGVASGMQNAKTEYIVTVPCDSPLLPNNLVSNLYQQLQKENAHLAVAHDGKRMQQMFALLRCDLLSDLLLYLESGERKVENWYAQHRTALADFSKTSNAFININSPDDLEAVEKLLSTLGSS